MKWKVCKLTIILIFEEVLLLFYTVTSEDDGRRSGHGDAPEGSTSDQDSVTSAFYVR